MTRFAAWFAVAIVLLPDAAAAQRSLFVEGANDLARSMLSTSADPARTRIALDKMAAGLDGWEAPHAPGPGFFGDEAADPPALPLAAYAEGFSRLARGDYREAMEWLRRADATAGDERSALAAAGRLAAEGRQLEAEQALQSIVAARPASAMARWWLARVYENVNKVSDARREYEVVVAVALTGRASLYADIGRLADAEGDFARASDAFERRARLTPNDPVAHKDLAWVHLKQDKTTQALASLGTVVALEPRDAEAHAAIGRIHLEAGLHVEAIRALQRALALRPDLHEARFALAQALKQSGRGEEAARELELFERARREATEDRRRTMAAEAARQEEARQDDRQKDTQGRPR